MPGRLRRHATALLGLVAFLRWYEPNTTLSAVPWGYEAQHGEFGAAYESPGRLRVLASFDTKTSLWSDGRTRLASTFYRLGLVYELTPRLTLELGHGSWHILEKTGRTQSYNRLGLEVEL